MKIIYIKSYKILFDKKTIINYKNEQKKWKIYKLVKKEINLNICKDFFWLITSVLIEIYIFFKFD